MAPQQTYTPMLPALHPRQRSESHPYRPAPTGPTVTQRLTARQRMDGLTLILLEALSPEQVRRVLLSLA